MKLTSSSYPHQYPFFPAAFPENLRPEFILRQVQAKTSLWAGKLKDQLQKLTTASESSEEQQYFGNKFKFLHDYRNKAKTRSSLLKIKKQIDQLEEKIKAPMKLRPSYASFDYIDSYFIELDKKGVMRLIETQNGRIHEVRRTRDLDELLYWVLSEITFTMACMDQEKESGHADPRIGIFIRQEELLGQLYPHWQDKKHAEYELFMKNHPKDELPASDPDYCSALRKLIRSETIEKEPNYFRFS